MGRFRNRWVLRALLVLGIGLLAIQLVPYRVSNPSARDEPPWDSPRTRTLAVAACFDCHSNETKVVWFERVAPLSWWITSHVDDGRAALNFSEFSTRHGESGDAVETINNGSMPPDYYTWLGMHSNAKLTKAKVQQLVDGLRATYAAAGVKGG
ncbi:MAG: heme-binding domain-containing protein [Acidimicrobiia bacterium]|nr:heme-binding domain-containing protein [Acidimicrobiia bacterium]